MMLVRKVSWEIEHLLTSSESRIHCDAGSSCWKASVMPDTVASVGEGCCFATVSAGEGEAGGEVDEDRFCSLNGYIWFGELQQQQLQDVEGEVGDEDDIRLALARVMDDREAEERLSLFPESMLLPLVENGETKVSSLVMVLMILDDEVGEPLWEAPRPTAAQRGYEKEDVVEVEEDEEDDDEDMGRWEVTSTLLLERVSESRRPGRGDGAGEG